MFIGPWLYKNYCRLITIDLTRQKEFDVDSKVIQQIEFIGQLKNPDDAVVAYLS